MTPAARTFAAIPVALAITACALEVEREEPVSSVEQAVTEDNALTKNALTKNALTKNALTKNALTKNALTKNALTKNSIQVDGQTVEITDPAHPYQVLRTDAGARTLLTYLYECAMPAGASMTINFDGTDYVFAGSLGLAPEWGQESGECNQSCQRWVSACLLARSNPYGVSVNISLRAQNHPALQSTAAEQQQFAWNDGAFFGNVFAPTLQMNACNAVFAIGHSVGRGCATGAPGCPDELDDLGDCPAWCNHQNPNTGGSPNPNPYPYSSCHDRAGTVYAEVITVYVAAPELDAGGQSRCDSYDNDFDGQTDEGFHKGEACDGTDADYCQNGIVVCDPQNPLRSICQESPSTNKVESCNGLDDDCDGVIDNGLTMQGFYRDADGDGFGAGVPYPMCAAAPGWVSQAGDCNDASATARPGAAELCNGVDDDCDGQVDEGFAALGVGQACDGGDGDLCAEGVLRCNAAGAVYCSDSTGTKLDVCNGADDDCNPVTIDGAADPQLGQACDGADGDACNEGALACQSGALVCGDYTGTSSESCNGADDDCDGQVDEGVCSASFFFAADGAVRIEAERYDFAAAAAGHAWVGDATAGASSGAAPEPQIEGPIGVDVGEDGEIGFPSEKPHPPAVRAMPDSGARIEMAEAPQQSPRLDYRVQFDQAGRYYLFVRGMATGSDDDSLHVGLDGAPLASSNKLDLDDDDLAGQWGWSNEDTDGVVAYIDVPSAGVHVINVWMREDGLRLDQLALSADPSWHPIAPIAVEAEAYSSIASFGSKRWQEESVAGASGGSAMRAVPDYTSYSGSNLAMTPRLDYEVEFPEPGTYHVWVRGRCSSSLGQDSFFLGLDGVVPASNNYFDYDFSGCNGWLWADDDQQAVLHVPAAGVYTVNVWVRDGGLKLDQLVFTMSSTYQP